MSRIDAPFGNQLLNEKTAPEERFEQALDEFDVYGSFRSLLTKHFSGNWRSVFRSIESLEDALNNAQDRESEAEKFVAFLCSSSILPTLSLEYSSKFLDQLNERPDKYYPRLNFAIDVATTIFARSPYAFYSSGIGRALGIHGYGNLFVSTFYGEDYCLTEVFFNDEGLSAEGVIARSRLLLNYYLDIAGTYASQSNQLLGLLADDVRVESDERHDDLLKGVEFLQSWFKHDAKAGLVGAESLEVINEILIDWKYDLLREIESVDEQSIEIENFQTSALRWLNETYLKLKKEFFVCSNLNAAESSEKKFWAQGVDGLFTNICRDSFDDCSPDDWQSHCKLCQTDLASNLSSLQLQTWIKWSLDSDIQSILRSEHQGSFPRSEKWWDMDNVQVWKDSFFETYKNLSAKEQVLILGSRLPYSGNSTYNEVKSWWNDLLKDVINDKDFPRELTPQWVKASEGRLEAEERKPFIDKSLGILRRSISDGYEAGDEKLLNALLLELDRLDPPKSLRHRLMFMRASSTPCSDENAARFSSFDEERPAKWYLSFDVLAKDWLNLKQQSLRGETINDWERIEVESYEELSCCLAEYFLSRLKLRKGEKARTDKYNHDQVIEPSPIWRQGYLKALGELGFDLKGNVHKTVNFTKKADPDESVREIASECYRLVRRASKKTRSVQELKRGMIAAEWWLLICQREELKMSVNYEEALKVRRRSLRNP
jgi:hypothetical protein